MNEELKVKLREELATDYDHPDYDPRVEAGRVRALECDIVNRFGFEGVKLVFEDRNSSNFHLIGQFPAASPWAYLNDKALPEFVEANFAPIAPKIPTLLFTLKEQCTFIYCEEKEEQWYLHYLFSHMQDRFGGGEYLTVYTGGAPLLTPEPNESLRAQGWPIPDDLATFYAIHNGFGQEEDCYCVLPNDQLEIMAASTSEQGPDDIFDFLSAQLSDKINLDPAPPKEQEPCNDLLKFYPDNAGNAQCFYKKGQNTTVRWWHDDENAFEEIGFFEFIDQAMSDLDDPF
ncbi:MAG TPA: hypothetical protein DCR93_16320 [Cytophagales bacterium]|nr:hypothetical protein [Cytophagales bacterium]HAP60992.1 hypothetical protein [Cytophagales bacterium]